AVCGMPPARPSARSPALAALRDQAIDVSSGRRRYIWGLVMTLAGLVALFVGLFGNASGSTPALLTGVAAFLVFIGVAMLSPLFARPAAKALTWPAEKS